jgi:hypothetical protein
LEFHSAILERMASSWRALAGLAFFAACSPDAPTGIRTVFDPCRPVELVADGVATSDERASMAAAIDLWRNAAALRATLDPAASHLPIRFQMAAGAFHGLYDDQIGEIFVNASFVSADARTITIAHEMGHAFGLTHVPTSERTSLMNPGNTTVPPTAEDVATLVAMWGRCEESTSAASSSARGR